ncbi:MAG: TetR/AcrR family transcriptional regulator [Pirellulaceae bacterium]|jgi:AcrR family transcriptional regulator|nr:TetR/AcrR family transcriptional regulator [Pirellulaceae bacterium]
MPRLSKTRKELLTTMMKDSILEAATSVLCTHGVDGTTMDRVAAAADLAKSSLYDYFRNKDELLEFVAQRIMVPTADRIVEAAQLPLTAIEKLSAIVRVTFVSVEEHRALLAFLVQGNVRHRRDPRGEASRTRVVDTVAGVLVQGMRDGEVRSDDPMHLARLFVACLAEYCELWIASSEPAGVEQCVEKLMTFFLRGVAEGAGGGRVAPT